MEPESYIRRRSTIFWVGWIQYTLLHHVSIRHILILSLHLSVCSFVFFSITEYMILQKFEIGDLLICQDYCQFSVGVFRELLYVFWDDLNQSKFL
jgi:hypothetical protein